MTLFPGDETFPEDLAASHVHAEGVAAWLRRRGFDAEYVAPPLVPPEDYPESERGADIRVEWRGRTVHVDTKQRMFDFDSAETFPYGTTIVVNCHEWDRANPKPDAFIHTNRDSTACLVVRASTFPAWAKRKLRSRNRWRWVYEIPVARCEFRRMTA